MCGHFSGSAAEPRWWHTGTHWYTLAHWHTGTPLKWIEATNSVPFSRRFLSYLNFFLFFTRPFLLPLFFIFFFLRFILDSIGSIRETRSFSLASGFAFRHTKPPSSPQNRLNSSTRSPCLASDERHHFSFVFALDGSFTTTNSTHQFPQTPKRLDSAELSVTTRNIGGGIAGHRGITHLQTATHFSSLSFDLIKSQIFVVVFSLLISNTRL